MESNKEKNTILILRIIIVLLIIAIILIAVFKKINSNNKNNEVDNTETENNVNEIYNNMEDEETITTTEAKVRLNVTGDYYEYVDLSIEDDYILATSSKEYRTNDEEKTTTYKSVEKKFTIENEKAKYLHYDYYQSGQTSVIYILTESGNVYVNEFTANNQTIDIINEFKKMNYSNVLELVKKKNENYGTENEVGIVDNKMYYIYARTNNELIKLDNQYAV